ncbi:MAG: chemotaxis protein CheA [Desulfobacterales bacterium]
MNSRKSELKTAFQRYADEIEAYSLNDPTAWSGLAGWLASAAGERGEGLEPVRRLALVCREGAAAISERRLTDYLSVVDALSAGFLAAARFLGEEPGSEGEIEARIVKLESLIPAAPSEPASKSEEVPSLDDIAAMLIQVEPDQPEAIRSLLSALESLGRTEKLPGSARIRVQSAAETVHGVLDGRLIDIPAALIETGRLLEAAAEYRDAPPGETGATPLRAESSADEAETDQESMSGADPASTSQAAGATDHMPRDPDLDLLGEFVEESNEQIGNAEEALLGLETDPDDMEAVGTVFRAFHTIKGTSAFLELGIISEMGHHAENLLSRVRDREIRYAGGYADLSLRALDMLKEMVQGVQEAVGGAPLRKPAGYDELLCTLSNPEASGISDEETAPDRPRIGDLLVAQGKVNREDVETAARKPRIGDILVAQGRADRDAVEAAVGDGSGGGPIGTRIVRSKTARLADVGQALRTQKQMKSGPRSVDTSVRVSTERLDRLIDMVGELVIAHSMVAQDDLVLNSSHHELIKKVAHTSKIVRELQDISMSLRMVPLKGTFNKMARLVRDVARKLGKKVEFVTEGEETEIDRNLVDVINDPLVHMIRNAVDHGIEQPEERKTAGKPETGIVKLSAYHSAGNVVVEIRDDGKGLDRKAIVEKAVNKGLISDGGHLTDREVFNLVFEPGFSTAAEITDVSGRGVGMDVVRKNIESLRGQTEIQSVGGKGSVFKMSLPLTLAIIDGMVVRVGAESYVIPTASIVKSIKPSADHISTVHETGRMISVQGELIPLMHLADLYDIASAGRDEEEELVIIVEDERSKAGLVIDELMGRQQVVIKTLGETMRNIPGISGSAIMPNGRVGLILDVGGLLRYADARGNEAGKDLRATQSAGA